MAEGKKSFIAYSDWSGTFKAVPDEIAGQLIKYIFSYVNDEAPEPHDNFIVNALFEQIKATLKRDLNKWDKQRKQRSEAGKKSAKVRATKSNERSTSVNGKVRNPTVNDNDNDNVNDINTNVFKKENYSKQNFFEDWNELRKEHLKKPSHLNQLNSYDFSEFKNLKESYSRDDFKYAMIGLFKQKVLPNGNTSMQSNPTHLFKSFNSYLTAYHDKNQSLYGKKQIQE